MLSNILISKALMIFIVILVTIALFSLIQLMIKSYHIKKACENMELYGGAIPATLVIKYIKKLPKILKNKSVQIKQLLNSLTDYQLNVISEILEVDFNQLKVYKNNSINAVNKGVDMVNNTNKLLKAIN